MYIHDLDMDYHGNKDNIYMDYFYKFDISYFHTYDNSYTLYHNYYNYNCILSRSIYKDSIHILYNIGNLQNDNQDNICRDNFYIVSNKYI